MRGHGGPGHAGPAFQGPAGPIPQAPSGPGAQGASGARRQGPARHDPQGRRSDALPARRGPAADPGGGRRAQRPGEGLGHRRHPRRGGRGARGRLARGGAGDPRDQGPPGPAPGARAAPARQRGRARRPGPRPQGGRGGGAPFRRGPQGRAGAGQGRHRGRDLRLPHRPQRQGPGLGPRVHHHQAGLHGAHPLAGDHVAAHGAPDLRRGAHPPGPGLPGRHRIGLHQQRPQLRPGRGHVAVHPVHGAHLRAQRQRLGGGAAGSRQGHARLGPVPAPPVRDLRGLVPGPGRLQRRTPHHRSRRPEPGQPQFLGHGPQPLAPEPDQELRARTVRGHPHRPRPRALRFQGGAAPALRLRDRGSGPHDQPRRPGPPRGHRRGDPPGAEPRAAAVQHPSGTLHPAGPAGPRRRHRAGPGPDPGRPAAGLQDLQDPPG